MEKLNKSEFINKSVGTLGELFDLMANLPAQRLRDLQPSQTVLVVVDMVNGFVREGLLKSPRVEELIPVIASLAKSCDELGIAKVAFADCHTVGSLEFEAFPSHCLAGSTESDIVDEIREVGGFDLIPKNSTNGFLEEEFQKWLKVNQHLTTFIITGNCTDLCVQQFALTLKAYFNLIDKKARIIVPANAVETYDLGLHNGDLMDVFALYNLMVNGIEVVSSI